MTSTASRADRISLRVSREAKRKLERAAAFSDKTLTDFVVEVALQKADAVVREQTVIALTAPEWKRFEALLLDPPAPGRRLKRAYAEHARIVRR